MVEAGGTNCNENGGECLGAVVAMVESVGERQLRMSGGGNG